jgi:hypothetical protein
VDDLSGLGAFRPKIDPVHIAVGIPHRAMMRMIVLLAHGVMDHGIIASHLRATRANHRIIINVWSAGVDVVREELTIDFDAHLAVRIRHLNAFAFVRGGSRAGQGCDGKKSGHKHGCSFVDH